MSQEDTSTCFKISTIIVNHIRIAPFPKLCGAFWLYCSFTLLGAPFLIYFREIYSTFSTTIVSFHKY
jgi:hypothetical protein